MNSASEDIKDILESISSLGLALATDLFIGLEPSTPDDCVTIFDTPGGPPELNFDGAGDLSNPFIQIRVRNNAYLTGWNVMNDINTELHGLGSPSEVWNGTTYLLIECTQEPALLDWDQNGRARFVVTYNITRK